MIRTLTALLLTLVFSTTAMAVDLGLERLLSPGELSLPHAELEQECSACHSNSQPKKTNAMCLECHEEVADDFATKRGFHGLKPGIAKSECRLCHSEHRGRQFNIVQLSPQTFDHSFTDFPLKNKHAPVRCEQCHVENKPFREAPSLCVDCHREDDVHKGSQGEQCQDCHSAAGWRQARFDHSATEFPLQGRHEQVACTQCHRSSDFKQAPTQCIGCHKIDDVHLNQFGETCQDCHSVNRWSDTQFSHAARTAFALKGAHRNLSCASCHKENTVAAELPMTCNGCHQYDDVHFGQNGKDCAQCHNNERWNDSGFDHGKTAFPLQGAHQNVRCERCHVNGVQAKLRWSGCSGCHQSDDPHQQTLGKQCQRCHNEVGWDHKIRFDHELTPFPLLGAHATTACENCHEDYRFIGHGTACGSCHQNDDIHKGNLGDQCQSCHHPAGWSSWRFDHDAQTHFPLTGAHKGLECSGCHGQSMDTIKQFQGQCGQCHKGDDIHRGAYGLDCQRCHTESNFSTLQMR